MVKRIRTLDDARSAYLNSKITREEFYSFLRKHAIVDTERKIIEKNNKKIERQLAHV